MFDPEPDRTCWFVRRTADGLDWLGFQRFTDDSAYVCSSDDERIYENKPDVWRDAVRDILERGYLHYADALTTGLVSDADDPPANIYDALP